DGHRPQLTARRGRPPAAVAQVEQAGPVLDVAQAVDLADELVEVAEIDELLVLGGQTIGHGYGRPERASGKTGFRTKAAARAARASRSSSSSRAASWTGTDTASRAASATSGSGAGGPARYQISVRSLGSAGKQRPWSTYQ